MDLLNMKDLHYHDLLLLFLFMRHTLYKFKKNTGSTSVLPHLFKSKKAE